MRGEGEGSGRARLVDAVAVIALAAVAARVRMGSLPEDGLWFDDSWVAAGAILGRPGQLLTVGSGHPAFTGLLMVVDRMGGGLRALGVPSLIAGIAGPPLLYLVLRSTQVARAIALVLAAALVVAPIHILYSGRVKGYTFDTLLILALALVVPWLARRRWGWATAAAWTVGAVGVALFSGYLLVATATAGVILVLHPKGDRRVRVVAVSAQAVVQAIYLWQARSRTDLAGVEAVMETAYDGHIAFSANPIEFAGEGLKHLRRVAEVYPGGAGAWLTVLSVLAIAGLIVGAVRARSSAEAVLARWMLLMLALAFVGALVDQFPFGLDNSQAISPGGRHTLWMIPSLAFGLAALAQRAWEQVAGRRRSIRIALDGLALLVVVAIIVPGFHDPPAAPFPGSASANQFALATAGPDDLIILGGTSTFAFAIDTDTEVKVVDTPTHQVGFGPAYQDPRIRVAGVWAVDPVSGAEVTDLIATADRVVVVANGPMGRRGLQVDAELEAAGFVPQTHTFDWSVVTVWTRDASVEAEPVEGA